jgi:charged multivesicular body protein 2B
MLRREEQRLIAEIKQAAGRSSGQNQAAMRALAKALVRLRAQIAKLTGSSAQLRGVSTSLTAAAATNTVASATQSATRAMVGVQKAMPAREVGKAMREFSKESSRLAAAEELVEETLDSALGCGGEGGDYGEDEDEAAAELVSQVLDEVGVGVAAASPAAPRRAAGALQRSPAAVGASGSGKVAAAALPAQARREVIAVGSGEAGSDEGGGDLDKLAARLAGLRGE